MGISCDCEERADQAQPDTHAQIKHHTRGRGAIIPEEEEQSLLTDDETSASISSVSSYPPDPKDVLPVFNDNSSESVDDILRPLHILEASQLPSTSILIDFALEAMEHQRDSLRLAAQNIFPLKGWLEKKQCSPPYFWMKRYVVCKDGYLLWSDREMAIKNGVTDEEKKRWSKCIKLRRIKCVAVIECKKQRKFTLRLKYTERQWIWRAQSKDWRDYWVNGMAERMDYAHKKTLFRAQTM